MKRIRQIIVSALLLLSATAVQAVPAYHGLHSVLQSDGSTLSYYLVGDEHCHGFITTDGYMISPNADGTMCYVDVDAYGGTTATGVVAHNVEARSVAEAMRLESMNKADFGAIYKQKMSKSAPMKVLGGDFPTTGNLRGLILLVEFNDNSMQADHTRDVFYSEMNDSACSANGATGSSRDYFISQSMGAFTPKFDVFGPIKLKKNMAFYGQNNGQGEDSNPGLMVKEASEYAHDSLGVNFSNYDFDNNGIVDFVYVIYAGYAESYGASSNTIWPHASNLQSLGIDCTLDGKQLQRYACSSELKYTSGTKLEGIGTFCHEFGHVLGLADMYNTRSSSDVQLGLWDIMDQGNYNNESHTPPSYSAFERYSLGWLKYTEIDTPADSMTLAELTKNNVAYRISTSDANEYFTLENRQQVGWDAYQPGKGLMIAHVKYDASFWNGNYVNAGSYPHYDIEEADGTQGYKQETDLYPISTNDMFTDYSTPNSLSWSGTPTEKGVTKIKDNDGVISFCFMKDRLRRPVLTEATDITDSSFVANWESVDDAVAYRLNMNEILPDSLNPLVVDEDFSGMTEGAYPKSGTTNISETMETYMKNSGWYGTELYSCGGYLRIGGYGVSGSLTSRSYDMSAQNGTATVAFHAVSYPGKKVSFNVSLTDMNTGNVINTYSLKADKTEKFYRLVFNNCTNLTRITISTDKERLFLNDLKVLEGDLDSVAVMTAGPKSWVIDSIVGNSVKVTGLVSNRTYTYNVNALSKDELRSSLSSDTQQVTTAFNTGIVNVQNTASRKIVAVTYHDISGRSVSSIHSGMVIRTTIYDDGTRETNKYIVR
jgi:M6 family metalloprotease-like protein